MNKLNKITTIYNVNKNMHSYYSFFNTTKNEYTENSLLTLTAVY